MYTQKIIPANIFIMVKKRALKLTNEHHCIRQSEKNNELDHIIANENDANSRSTHLFNNQIEKLTSENR